MIVNFNDSFSVGGWTVKSTRWFQSFMGLKPTPSGILAMTLVNSERLYAKYTWREMLRAHFYHRYRAGIVKGIFCVDFVQMTPIGGLEIYINALNISSLTLRTGIGFIAPRRIYREKWRNSTGIALRRFFRGCTHGSAKEFEEFRMNFY